MNRQHFTLRTAGSVLKKGDRHLAATSWFEDFAVSSEPVPVFHRAARGGIVNMFTGLLATLGLVLLSPASAPAGTITITGGSISAETTLRYGSNLDSYGGGGSDLTGGAAIAGGSGAGSGFAFADSGTFINSSFVAAAYQDYGIFGGDASVAVSRPFGSGLRFEGWIVRATGVSQETWTITGGVGQALLKLGFAVSGSTSSSGSFPVTGGNFYTSASMGINIFTIAPDPTGGLIQGNTTTGPIYAAGFYSADGGGTLPFTFGVPFSVRITSQVTAGTGWDGSLPSFAGIAQAYFGHTATLSSVGATDLFGNPISGIQITASSGTQYDESGVHRSSTTNGAGAVPEPSSMILWGVGFMLVSVRTRWRHSRAQRATYAGLGTETAISL